MILKTEQDFPLSIIIPAFNEENRLPDTVRDLFAYFHSAVSGFQLKELILVDDGSLDRTLDVITDLKRSFPLIRLIHFSDNQGKGAAVKAGLMKAEGQWVLIADADQSTPWAEMEVLLKASLASHADLTMGSRAVDPAQVQVRQAWWREGMGKFFNSIVRFLFALSFLDTQCGFKLLKRNPAVDREIQQMLIRRFAWDVEMILRLLRINSKIIEIPVVWKNKLHSRVHPVRDSFEMLYQLIKLKIILKNDAAHTSSSDYEK